MNEKLTTTAGEEDLLAAYRDMAEEEEREAEAHAWAEAMVGDALGT